MTAVQTLSGGASARRFLLGLAAYVVPSFPIAFVWHLVAFAGVYDALQIYRDDVIIPFGLASMLIQAAIFSFAYPRLFPARGSAWLGPGLAYGAGLAILSWTFTTLAVAAKHPMTSIPTFLVLETGFTAAQFLVVGPLIALAHRN